MIYLLCSVGNRCVGHGESADYIELGTMGGYAQIVIPYFDTLEEAQRFKKDNDLSHKVVALENYKCQLSRN